MTEINFFQSWAFWFLAGIIVGFALGFILAIIIAASGKGSRMKEKIEDSIKFEIATKGKPENA